MERDTGTVKDGVKNTVETAELTSQETSTQAVQDHLGRMAALRRRYIVVVSVVVAVCVAAFVIAVQRGEISHVRLQTASSAAPTLTPGPVSAQLTIAWQSSDTTAIGMPFYGGTVVTYSPHTVTGRDATTGVARWSFTRSDRALCSVAEESGHVFALFRAKGDCDELTILDTGTGARTSERTLDDDGHLVVGTPIVLPDPESVVLVTDTLVRSINLGNGYNNWTYSAPSGCQNMRAVRGSSGVLVSQHCTDGDYLLLRDPTAADSSTTNNLKWRVRAQGAVPAAADDFVAALDTGTRTLRLYAVSTGAIVTAAVTLTPTPSPLRPLAQSTTAQGELLWIGDTSYALNEQGTAQLWSLASSTLPTFSGPQTPSGQLDFTTLAVPTNNSIAVLNQDSGAIEKSYGTQVVFGAGAAIRVGTGFLLTASSATVMYH